MRLETHGHNVEVTPAMREYVESKMTRLARHSHSLMDARVQLTMDANVQKAEGNLHCAGKDLHADAVGQDIYAAIDLLADKLDRQLMKFKEKQVDTHRRAEGIARSTTL